MLTRRRLRVAALTAGLLAFSSLSLAAEQDRVNTEPHQTTIDNLVEIAQSMADHEVIAQRFDEEAAQLDTQAAQHERLARHYKSGFGVGPKGNAASLANHCERIARSLKQAADDAREMARMHRDIAHQLVK